MVTALLKYLNLALISFCTTESFHPVIEVTIIRHVVAQVTVVLFVIYGCINCSDDGSGISFFGTPTVTDRYGEAEVANKEMDFWLLFSGKI